MNRESLWVLGTMLAVVLVLVVARVAYEDIVALFDKPSAEAMAKGEQAIDELERLAESSDSLDLIATVAPCEPGRDYEDACLTVTANWGRASNRQQIAADLWKGWADICTQRGLAEEAADCRIEIHSADGERIGGSGDDDGSRIWVKE